ncbi:ImmA/IrrE family metallo-endopeptidase [Kitasatospora sp. P5_F3]
MTDNEARAIAEAQAERLLELFEIKEPSVDVGRIAELPRVDVRIASPLPVSGLTYWEKSRWVVAIRRDDSTTRRRFTLAHELKHIIDHPYVDVLYPQTQASDETTKGQAAKQVEAICDHFAACLLMPAAWVRRYWQQGLREVEVLARLFKVSPAAMTIRLGVLGLFARTNRPVKTHQEAKRYFRARSASTAAHPADGRCAHQTLSLR